MDETRQTPKTPSQKLMRSPNFRSLFINNFVYRVGYGEIGFVFSTLGTDDTPSAGPALTQEVEIFMTWSQAKNLAMTLERAVSVIEAEVGAIPVSAPDEAKDAQTIEALRAHIGILGLPRP